MYLYSTAMLFVSKNALNVLHDCMRTASKTVVPCGTINRLQVGHNQTTQCTVLAECPQGQLVVWVVFSFSAEATVYCQLCAAHTRNTAFVLLSFRHCHQPKGGKKLQCELLSSKLVEDGLNSFDKSLHKNIPYNFHLK